MDTYTVESLYVSFGVVAIKFVNDITYAYVRTNFQCTGHVDILIASATPVVVFHRTTVHLHYSTACMDYKTGIIGNDPVVKSHEERGDLEHGTRLTAVADSVIYHFMVFSIGTACHIHNSLYVTGLYFH